MTVTSRGRLAALLAAGVLIVFAATPVFAKAAGPRSADDVRAALLAAEQVDAETDEGTELEEMEDELEARIHGRSAEQQAAHANGMSAAARDGIGHGASEEAHERNALRKAAHVPGDDESGDDDEADEADDDEAEVSPEPSAEAPQG